MAKKFHERLLLFLGLGAEALLVVCWRIRKPRSRFSRPIRLSQQSFNGYTMGGGWSSAVVNDFPAL